MPMFMTLTTTILIIVILTCLLTGFWRGNRLPILMYHKVRPESGDAWTVTLKDFQSHLKILSAQGYQSISFRQLFDPSSTLPPKPVLLTFDDAYADFEAHPLAAMEQCGFASTVFLPVGHVGGENAWDGGGEPIMNWDDVRRLSAGNTEFGLHSYNHDNFQDLTLDEMRADLLRCMATLDEQRVPFQKILAYPYGGFPRMQPMRSEMKALFKSLGLNGAVRIGSRIERTPPRHPYELRRVIMQRGDRSIRFRLKLLLGKIKL
jgi:peptidoglycan/xylan/chitin deacetylase (PgdA/CDA1 family)